MLPGFFTVHCGIFLWSESRVSVHCFDRLF